MKVVKRIFLSLVLVALFVFLVIPPLMGLYIKHRYNEAINQLNDAFPNTTFRVDHYQLGWFASKAHFTIDAHRPSHENGHDFRFTGEASIQQGPVIYKLNPENKNRFAIASLTTEIPSLQLSSHSTWHFSNIIKSKFSSPGFSFQEKQAINLKNLQGDSSYHFSAHHYQLDLSIQKFSLSQAIDLSGLHYTVQTSYQNKNKLSEKNLNLKNALLHLKNGDKVALNDLSGLLRINDLDGRSHIKFLYDIPSISNNAFDIQRIKFALQIIGAPTQETLKLKKDFDQRYTPGTTVNYKVLINDALELLRQGFNVQLDTLRVETTKGNLIVGGSVLVPQLAKDTTVQELPQKLDINLDLQIPKEWLKTYLTGYIRAQQSALRQQPGNEEKSFPAPEAMAETNIQHWLTQQLLTATENEYKTNIEFKNGQLTINGHALEKFPTVLLSQTDNSTENTAPESTPEPETKTP